jgi:hypothetical protein
MRLRRALCLVINRPTLRHDAANPDAAPAPGAATAAPACGVACILRCAATISFCFSPSFVSSAVSWLSSLSLCCAGSSCEQAGGGRHRERWASTGSAAPLRRDELQPLAHVRPRLHQVLLHQQRAHQLVHARILLPQLQLLAAAQKGRGVSRQFCLDHPGGRGGLGSEEAASATPVHAPSSPYRSRSAAAHTAASRFPPCSTLQRETLEVSVAGGHAAPGAFVHVRRRRRCRRTLLQVSVRGHLRLQLLLRSRCWGGHGCRRQAGAASTAPPLWTHAL